MLARSAIAQRMFASPEFLMPAKAFCALDGVEILHEAREVVFFHLLFDRHEVIFAEGAPAESLYLGTEVQKGFCAETARELAEILPDLMAPGLELCALRTRPFVPGKRARRFLERSQKNDRPIVAGRSARP